MKRQNAALLTALLVPAFAGLVTMDAYADRHLTGEAIPAAVVNADVMGELPDGTPLPAGRLLVAELIDPAQGDETPFAWEVVRPRRRQPAPVRDWPSPRSRRTSPPSSTSSEAEPRRRSISRRRTREPGGGVHSPSGSRRPLPTSSVGSSPVLPEGRSATGQIADAFLQAVDGRPARGRRRAGGPGAQTRLRTDSLADGLFELPAAPRRSRTGGPAGRWCGQPGGWRRAARRRDQPPADGAGSLADGVGQIADGTTQLADGAGSLADGVGQLADGTTQLADGVGQFSGGVHELAVASNTLTEGAGGIADGASQLADGVGQMVDGFTQIPGEFGIDPDTVVPQLQAALDAARQALDGIAVLKGQLEEQFGTLAELQAYLDQIRADLEQAVQDGAAQAREYVNAAVGEMCATATTPEAIEICDALAAATDPAVLDPALQQALDELQARIDALQADIDAMPTGIPEYPTFGELWAHLEELASSTGDLPSVEELQSYLDTAQGLIDQLPAMAEGLQQLRDGADQLATGTSEYYTGMQQFNEGMQQLDTGAGDLATGADQLADGAGSAPMVPRSWPMVRTSSRTGRVGGRWRLAAGRWCGPAADGAGSVSMVPAAGRWRGPARRRRRAVADGSIQAANVPQLAD